MRADTLPLLRTIQDSLVEGLSAGRNVHSAGGFKLLLHSTDPLFYLNQAVPVMAPFDVLALLQEFAESDRRPWLELCLDLWPELPFLLESAGLVCHQRMPLMVLDRASFTPNEFGAHLADSGDLVGLTSLSAAVFGGERANADAMQELSESVASGRVLAAVKVVGGRVISCGQAVGTRNCRELVGIATRDDFRRQGHATDVIRCLLDAHFTAGGEIAWLTPGDEGAEEAYRRCGFLEMATQVGYGPSDVNLSMHTSSFGGS